MLETKKVKGGDEKEGIKDLEGSIGLKQERQCLRLENIGK